LPDAEPSANSATDQYVLPPSIAPFEVVITITNVRETELLAAGERIACELTRAGVDVLLDDRDERAGVKFKDAELIGIPYRVNVGKKLAEGKVEIVDRLQHTSADVTIEALAAHIQSLLAASKS
jgi:prolyl-tRNA synthetase